MHRYSNGKTADNSVFAAHSVRPNWLTSTSQTSRMLADTASADTDDIR